MAGADYYDANDILAEETLIPCSFHAGAKGLGRIFDHNAGNDNLDKGSRVEAPLWLGSALAKRNMAEIRLPKFYGVKMQRKIDAGAGVEDLRARCPYFYDVADKLHEISNSEPLARFVNGCFRARYRELLTRAHSTNDYANVSLKTLFSQEELELYESGRHSMRSFDLWRRTGSSTMQKMAGPLKRKSSNAMSLVSEDSQTRRRQE